MFQNCDEKVHLATGTTFGCKISFTLFVKSGCAVHCHSPVQHELSLHLKIGDKESDGISSF